MPEFNAKRFLENQIKETRRALGKEKALIAVSGGVDSTVSAAITFRAIGDNLVCVFIDDNFMRVGEPERVKHLLSAPPLSLPVKILDEKELFMGALKGLKDAEDKRKAFRDAFYTTLSEAAKREDCRYLVQGTIKADIDETAAGVKTQHNILEQIGINPVEKYGYHVVEPLLALYKWQVREIARLIGMPEELSERQPFPGPGLSVRIVGEITQEKLEEEKNATIVAEECLAPLKPSQFFAAIFGSDPVINNERIAKEVREHLNITAVEAQIPHEKATGMIDGNRTYGNVLLLGLGAAKPTHGDIQDMRAEIQKKHPEYSRVLVKIGTRRGEGYRIALRAIETRDFLTANIVEVPWETLKDASEKIFKKCKKVNAVYFDVTPKPPSTIEFE